MMGLSDSLAALNHQRFQGFEDQNSYRAAWLFDGPSFKKLNVHDFSNDEIKKLDGQLCILSGLYGILKATDAIKPYRLEMGCRLDVDGEKNLYQFWEKHELTSELASLANGKCIVNCASQEYSKVINFDELRNEGVQIIDIVFQGNNGRLASVFAKQARGLFCRFVAKADPSSVEDLQSFTGDGHYVFKEQSGEKLIFERHATPQSDGDEVLWGGQQEAPKKKKGSTKKKQEKIATTKRTASKVKRSKK